MSAYFLQVERRKEEPARHGGKQDDSDGERKRMQRRDEPECASDKRQNGQSQTHSQYTCMMLHRHSDEIAVIGASRADLGDMTESPPRNPKRRACMRGFTLLARRRQFLRVNKYAAIGA